MRGYSPQHYSPPRRGYGNHGRSPPRRGHGGRGRGGRRREQNHGSLLVRNIPLDCRPEELRGPFEKYGQVRDVYIPRDYYTGLLRKLSKRRQVEPRGFAFVEFVDAYDASEARYHMNGKIFAGREISVVVAAESRKRPEDMRHRSRLRGPSSYGGQRSSYSGRSRSRSISRSRSPHHVSGSRNRYRSRSYSPAPKRRSDYSVSPRSRHGDHPKSPRDSRKERDDDHNHRSYSPGHDIGADRNRSSGYRELSPGRVSRSPSGPRSRSADPSPGRGR